MIEAIKINIPNGLHIRPAAKLVKIANNFEGDINILFNNSKANCKSLIEIQKLEILDGDTIDIEIEDINGSNEIIEEIKTLLSKQYYDKKAKND